MKWLVTLLAITFLAGSAAADKKPKVISIQVTENGFEPAAITVPGGKPVVLQFTRKVERTCVKRVILHVGGDKTIEKDLPLDQPVEIRTTFATGGELRYTCGMDMYSGTITVH